MEMLFVTPLKSNLNPELVTSLEALCGMVRTGDSFPTLHGRGEGTSS